MTTRSQSNPISFPTLVPVLSGISENGRTFLSREMASSAARRKSNRRNEQFLSIAVTRAYRRPFLPELLSQNIFPLLLSPFSRRERRGEAQYVRTAESGVISATNSIQRTLSASRLIRGALFVSNRSKDSSFPRDIVSAKGSYRTIPRYWDWRIIIVSMGIMTV